jgi:hypothetical protein
LAEVHLLKKVRDPFRRRKAPCPIPAVVELIPLLREKEVDVSVLVGSGEPGDAGRDGKAMSSPASECVAGGMEMRATGRAC